MKAGLLRGALCFLGLWSALLWAQPGLTHTVQRKETAYGIAKQYGVDLNALYDWNPWAEGGIRKGDVLRIPTTATEEVAADTVPPVSPSIEASEEAVIGGNLEESTGEVPEVSEQVRPRPLPPTWSMDTLRVGVFLPFQSGRDSLSRQEARLQQIAKDCEAGIRLALATEGLRGAHYEVGFFDSGRDTSGAMLCSEAELSALGGAVDIALGPLRRSRFQEVGRWLPMQGAVHVALTDLGGGLAEGRSGVVMPYVQVQDRMRGLAAHVASRHRGERVLMLATGDIRNLEAEDAFRAAWAALEANDSLLILSEVSVQSKGLGTLRDSLTDVRRNVLVVPGGKANRSLAGVLQTEMQLGDSLDFRLYADAAWKDFDFLDHDLRERVGFTVVDGYDTPPDSSRYHPVDSSYFCHAREMAWSRGRDSGAFGWMAYDALSDALLWTAGHGRDWVKGLAAGGALMGPGAKTEGHLHVFDWQPHGGEGDGVVNAAGRILCQQGYQWVEVNRFNRRP